MLQVKEKVRLSNPELANEDPEVICMMTSIDVAYWKVKFTFGSILIACFLIRCSCNVIYCTWSFLRDLHFTSGICFFTAAWYKAGTIKNICRFTLEQNLLPPFVKY